MLRILLFSLFILALGFAEGYFLFPKKKLDTKKGRLILLWIFGFAFLVWLEILGVIGYTSHHDLSIEDRASQFLLLFGVFLVGMAAYLIYYLCRRLKSFQKIFLLACVGAAGAVVMLLLGFWVSTLIV